MRARTRIAGASIVVIGAIAVVGVGAVVAGDRAAPPVTETAIRAPFAKGVLPAAPDSGRPRDRAAVRAAALLALNDEVRLFTIDLRHRRDPPGQLLAMLTSPTAEQSRLQLLRRSRSEQLAHDLDHAVVFFLRHDFGPDGPRPVDFDIWSTGAFHLDAWQGVQVVGDSARVIVRGEERGTSWEGRAVQHGWVQSKLLFERSASAAHGWRLVREQGASTAA